MGTGPPAARGRGSGPVDETAPTTEGALPRPAIRGARAGGTRQRNREENVRREEGGGGEDKGLSPAPLDSRCGSVGDGRLLAELECPRTVRQLA